MKPTETYVVQTESGDLLVGVWRGMSAFVDGGRFADAEATLAALAGAPIYATDKAAIPTYSVGYGKIGEGGTVHAFALLPLPENGFPVRTATHYQNVVALMLHEGQLHMDMWSVHDRVVDTAPHDYTPEQRGPGGSRRHFMAEEPYPYQYSVGERAHFGDGSRKILATDPSVIRCRKYTRHDWNGKSRDMGV
jgi:hypothetical protein